MSFVIGLDIGAVFVKGVLLTEDGRTICWREKSGKNYSETAERVRVRLLEVAGESTGDCRGVAVTGCGAGCLSFPAQKFNEMVCLARAVSETTGSCAVLDLGGQSCRTAALDEKGRLSAVSFSEKCASGSGNVLEKAANVLHVPFEELAALSEGADTPVEFTVSCAVFMESEIITAIANGKRPQDIAAGVHRAVAQKIYAMLSKAHQESLPVVASGGAAADAGVIRALEGLLGRGVTVVNAPQFTIAREAALSVLDQIHSA